jgi:5-methylcytosine-specific restriction endonuclease McrA
MPGVDILPRFGKPCRIQDTKALEDCKLKPCLITDCPAKADPHHIVSRKAGGHDLEHNLMPLCRGHHTEVHKIGLVTFSDKYEVVKEFLIGHGLELMMGKWKHSCG